MKKVMQEFPANDLERGIASSNGDTAPHACVGLNGRIVHDPNPMKPGLMGAIDDWQIGVFVSLFTKSRPTSTRRMTTPAAMARHGIQINSPSARIAATDDGKDSE